MWRKRIFTGINHYSYFRKRYDCNWKEILLQQHGVWCYPLTSQRPLRTLQSDFLSLPPASLLKSSTLASATHFACDCGGLKTAYESSFQLLINQSVLRNIGSLSSFLLVALSYLHWSCSGYLHRIYTLAQAPVLVSGSATL